MSPTNQKGAMSKQEEKVVIEVVEGVAGKALVVSEHRVAGPKPWGGGTVTDTWQVDRSELEKALGVLPQADLERQLADSFAPCGRPCCGQPPQEFVNAKGLLAYRCPDETCDNHLIEFSSIGAWNEKQRGGK